MQVQPAFQDRTMYIPTTCSRRLPWGFASGVSPGQKILFPGTNQRSFVVHLAAAKRFPFPIIPKDMSKLPTKAANNAMHRNALWQLQNVVSLTSPTWVTPSKIHMVIRTLFLLLFLFLNFHINYLIPFSSSHESIRHLVARIESPDWVHESLNSCPYSWWKEIRDDKEWDAGKSNPIPLSSYRDWSKRDPATEHEVALQPEMVYIFTVKMIVTQ